ncbi:hypothetical protein FA10DRAFT_184177 [Acaromyces ingoldii]|uniref:Uncharacterized protein n=1 Tax=Acaromyces ingoldii TaxID=215250 RepID=A0A316YH08_9BASI|nr:hypothetical protein FA10DRAFT_184177 [Acaromyces ingoldii]PWN87393.1 hypothetical protein FA10DRAFT_184177 [Acaromyces ingoldii]
MIKFRFKMRAALVGLAVVGLALIFAEGVQATPFNKHDNDVQVFSHAEEHQGYVEQDSSSPFAKGFHHSKLTTEPWHRLGTPTDILSHETFSPFEVHVGHNSLQSDRLDQESFVDASDAGDHHSLFIRRPAEAEKFWATKRETKDDFLNVIERRMEKGKNDASDLDRIREQLRSYNEDLAKEFGSFTAEEDSDSHRELLHQVGREEKARALREKMKAAFREENRRNGFVAQEFTEKQKEALKRIQVRNIRKSSRTIQQH